jgi:mannose-6-phosphate isomerase-like protein (cupin superfamily)
MLLTGLVLGQLRNLGSPGVTAVPAASNRQAMQAARDFYDAVNKILSSGDRVALRSILHAQFTDHSDYHEPGTAQDLETDLLALRQTFPDLQLEPLSISAHSGIVMTNLRVTGSPHGEVAAFAIESEVVDAELELLRVEEGAVIERWASPALPWPAHVQTIGTLDNIIPMTSIRTVHLERLTLEPFAQLVVGGHLGSMLIVESGSIGVLQGSPNSVPLSDSALGAGEAIAISAGSPFNIQNSEPRPASLLIVTIAAPPSPSLTSPSPASDQPDPGSGSTRAILTDRAPIRPDQGPFQLTVKQVEIGPNTSIARHVVAEAELLLVLEGTIEAAVHTDDIIMLTDQVSVARRPGLVTIAPGQGLTVNAGTELAYRVSGATPATILLVSIDPVTRQTW